MQYPFLSLVIPCYNESQRIDHMMTAVHQFIPKWKGALEVIVVNDGSSDDTSERIRQHVYFNEDHIQLLEQKNTGKGGALQLGVKNSSGDFILTLDADMASDPSELFGWMENEAWSTDEILIGSREKNQQLVQDKQHRKFIGHCFNYIIRTITGLKIDDTQCGFKLYPGSIGRKLFSQLQTPGWAHDVELLLRATKQHIKITEMPIHWQAVEGSKIRILRDSWNMFWEVIRIRRIV